MLLPVTIALSSLPSPGTPLAQLVRRFGPALKVLETGRHTRTFRLASSSIGNRRVQTAFVVHSATAKVNSILVSASSLERCHYLERAAGTEYGRYSSADWGTRAYTLFWKGTRQHMRIRFDLFAIQNRRGEDIGTQCNLVIG